MSPINSVPSQAPAIQFQQPQALQTPRQQPAAQQDNPMAKLNEALKALEQALQALSGSGAGQQKIGQDLGFSDQGGGNTGFNNDLFSGTSQFDAQPQQTWDWGVPSGGGGGNFGTPAFLDLKGGGAGNGGGNNGNHFGTFGDNKSGGGGGTVDPSGNRRGGWNW